MTYANRFEYLAPPLATHMKIDERTPQPAMPDDLVLRLLEDEPGGRTTVDFGSNKCNFSSPITFSAVQAMICFNGSSLFLLRDDAMAAKEPGKYSP